MPSNTHRHKKVVVTDAELRRAEDKAALRKVARAVISIAQRQLDEAAKKKGPRDERR